MTLTPRDQDSSEGASQPLALCIDGQEPVRSTAVDRRSVLERAEAALQTSREHLRLALGAARMGLWSWDVATDIHTRDGNLNQMLGLPAVESSQALAEFLEHIHPDDRQRVQAAFANSVAANKMLNTEFRVIWPDGTLRWLRDQGDVFGMGDASTLFMAGACMDVTERRQAEEALRATEERLRLVVENAAEFAIFTLNEERQVTSWNSGAQGIFGFTEEEIIGQSGDIVFTPEDRVGGAPEWEATTATAEGCAADERWHMRKDGTRFYASGVMRPLRASASNGFFKIARDLTFRKETEDQVRLARDLLEQRVLERTEELALANERLRIEARERDQAEQVRVDLLRRLANAQEEERLRISRELHDQAGQLLASLLLGLKKVEDVASPEHRALVNAQRVTANELAREVHDLAMELRPTALNDLGLVPALRAYLESWTDKSGIESEFQVVREGERLRPEIETALYRIVQEALHNTLKHSEATGVSVVIEHSDAAVTAIVEDNGIGFEPTAAPLVEPTRARLGLLGMRERTAMLGGSLEIESAAGEGTTIYARIPLSKPPQPTATP